MPWYDILWNYDDEDGNVAHVAEHGLTPDDVNAVLWIPKKRVAAICRDGPWRSATRRTADTFALCTRRLTKRRSIQLRLLRLRTNPCQNAKSAA